MQRWTGSWFFLGLTDLLDQTGKAVQLGVRQPPLRQLQQRRHRGGRGRIGEPLQYLGYGRASSPRTLWRFDPRADQWTALTQIPQGVHHAPFQHHAGRLYIPGGFRETSFEPVGNVRIFDLASGRWSEGAPMPTPRGATGWALLGGRIHVLGGTPPAPAQRPARSGRRRNRRLVHRRCTTHPLRKRHSSKDL
jgi:hypothetical protein